MNKQSSVTEGRLIIGLLVFLLLAEISFRFIEHRLSGNIAHILSIPEITRKLDTSQMQAGVVFIGNSLTNNAIDNKLIDNTLENISGTPVSSIKITPDGTALSDWYCIYRNHILNLEQPPALIVIGFAWAQLSDQYPVNPSRLGGFFCGLDDLADLSATGLTSHQELLRYLAGATSHVYANREPIRNRVLDTIIPYYQDITQRLNITDDARQAGESVNQPEYSYTLLSRLITTANENDIKLVFAAMPVVKPYELDMKLLQQTQTLGSPLMDLRNDSGITQNMFKDSIHLNRQGRLKLSHLVAGHIKPYLDKKQ